MYHGFLNSALSIWGFIPLYNRRYPFFEVFIDNYAINMF